MAKPEKLVYRPSPHILTSLPGLGYHQSGRFVEVWSLMLSYIRLSPASAGTSSLDCGSLDRGLPWCEPCFNLIDAVLPDES